MKKEKVEDLMIAKGVQIKKEKRLAWKNTVRSATTMTTTLHEDGGCGRLGSFKFEQGNCPIEETFPNTHRR
jgi:hypothetical protein